MTRCELCGRGPATTGDAVYRASPKGDSNPRWRCQFHLNSAAQTSREAVAGLVDTIEKAQRHEH